MGGAMSAIGGAAGGSSGGGLMSMLGGMAGGGGGSGGSSGGFGGLFGGGDVAKNPDDIHTQKVWGFDVPDLMRNMLQVGRNEKPVGFERLLGGNAPNSQPLSSPSQSPLQMGNTSDDSAINQEMASLDASLNKLRNYQPMQSPQQLPKTNFGLKLLSDQDMQL